MLNEYVIYNNLWMNGYVYIMIKYDDGYVIYNN